MEHRCLLGSHVKHRLFKYYIYININWNLYSILLSYLDDVSGHFVNSINLNV